MTAIAMTRDYGVEMLLGSSPVFSSGFLSGSPHLDFSLTNYWNSCSSQSCSSEPVLTVASRTNMYPQFQTDFGTNSISSSQDNAIETSSSRFFLERNGSVRRRKTGTVTPPSLNLLSPGKSCLVSRQEDLDGDGLTSPTRNKKKVSFADSNGLDLTQVRVITERPDCPPRWTQAFLDQVTGSAQPVVQMDHWELTFPQPASDYITWKGRLEKYNVAVENVVVRDAEGRIAGTVKVRNISFHKQVLIRYTTSNWSSHQEVEAIYQTLTTSASATYNLYDTFSFSIALPNALDADKLEFCVCYSCNGMNYWDNNNGKNYAIVCFKNRQPKRERRKPVDICDVKVDCWGEFATWNHLDEQGPYW